MNERISEGIKREVRREIIGGDTNLLYQEV